MRHDLKGRLARLERKGGRGTLEVWLNRGDGQVIAPDGRMLSQAEFDQRYPRAKRVTLNISHDYTSTAGFGATEWG
jgi:hypothetical protein